MMDELKPGDVCRITLRRFRRWWQFWKPRSWIETHEYEVQ